MEKQKQISKDFKAFKRKRDSANEALNNLRNKFEKKLIISAIECPRFRIATNNESDFDFTNLATEYRISELISIEFSLEIMISERNPYQATEFRFLQTISFNSIKGENERQASLLFDYNFEDYHNNAYSRYSAFCSYDKMQNRRFIYFENRDDYASAQKMILDNLQEFRNLVNKF